MRMKLFQAALAAGCLLTALMPRPARAFEAAHKAGQLAAGIVVGEPTGVSLKYWMDRTHAVDFAVGGLGFDGVLLHADYLWHRFGLFHSDRTDLEDNLPVYYGVGGVLGANAGGPFGGGASAGVRGVIGITYLFPEPFDLFLELAPTILVAPGFGFGFEGGLGGRYYF